MLPAAPFPSRAAPSKPSWGASLADSGKVMVHVYPPTLFSPSLEEDVLLEELLRVTEMSPAVSARHKKERHYSRNKRVFPDNGTSDNFEAHTSGARRTQV